MDCSPFNLLAKPNLVCLLDAVAGSMNDWISSSKTISVQTLLPMLTNDCNACFALQQQRYLSTLTTTMGDKVEDAKRKAAYQAVDDWVTVWILVPSTSHIVFMATIDGRGGAGFSLPPNCSVLCATTLDFWH